MSKNEWRYPYFGFGIILQGNHMRSEFYPAFIVCWDTRAKNNKQVFTLKRIRKMKHPVVLTTKEDVYELKELYSKFRISIRDKKHRPRKTRIYGILVSFHCNIDCTLICGPYYYICHINNGKAKGVNDNMKRWQTVYLEKERQSHIFDLADVLCSEEGTELSQNYTIPGIYGR